MIDNSDKKEPLILYKKQNMFYISIIAFIFFFIIHRWNDNELLFC